MSKATVTSKPRLRKFHVGTGQSDQEIIDQFVVRQHALDTVLEVLDGNIESDSCQHLLVVAPRGRGKTTLLVRVIAELRTNPRYRDRLLPLRLMEESQEVFTLADFWLECLYYLAKTSAPIDTALADELHASHAVLTKSWTDPALESRARATVLDAADRLGRKLVIMVENLQALCQDADKDFGWELRQVLQAEPQIMLLATATSRFAALEDAEAPFFELFRTLCLPPLDTEECRRLWEAITGEEVDTRRIRPLRILTGGSPRLMVVLAGFSRDHSLRQLMERLVELIDDHTEYFRGHIEDLAGSERRVYLALIDLWQESTTAEVAARARMEIRKVSAFLGRLVERGAVVAEGSGRNRTYYPAERLYSIYYKLRRDRDEAAVVRNLIHFMVTYYEGDELADLSRQLVIESFESDGIREGLARAAKEVPELRSLLESQEMAVRDLPQEGVDPESFEALIQIRRHFESGDFEAVIRLVDSLVAIDPGNPMIDPVTEAQAIRWKARAQGQLGDSAAEIATFAEVVERFGVSADRELRVHVARALVSKGVKQGELGDSVAAIATFDAVVERFGISADRELQVQVAWALALKGFAQSQLGDSVAAIETYAALVQCYGASTDRELQVLVARALLSKGLTQLEIGDSAAAIATLDALVERFGDSADRELQAEVALALFKKALTQEQLGDLAAVIQTCDAVVGRYGDIGDLELQMVVAWALVSKGAAQGQLGDPTAVIDISDAVVARFGDSKGPELQAQVARALINKGVAQGRLGDSAAAIATFAEVVERFGDSADQELLDEVDDAIRNAAETLCMMGDAEGALRKVDELRALARRAHLNEPLTDVAWVEAMARTLLGETARVDELFRDIRAAFDPDDESMLRAFQRYVPTLVALGAEPGVLAGVLEEDKETHEALRPLVVALRLEAGEKVRAPAEMLEVAADIRAAIEERRRQRTS
ncbi:tetratricopeptide repeat protein [Thiorhodococcus mannitoliphagus]|uniref:Tetratricopeptide repeat protein n=1 Tax=Thiorhodococcus mannitoliphagus TaxID=329406 RepID=A0A6P1DW64_9GAMM|nr:tetratricopeptide repeat protein [Thiorhodococcus mannitoliphagus]NEX22577.1 tetratricopeptide repeat protein [Thiorhodococcus mannitoliphagus]